MSTTDAEWQAWAEREAAKLEYKQMCDQVLAEQKASLAKKASDPAWQAEMHEIGMQMHAEVLANQILAEVKAETLAYKSQTRVRLRRLINCVDQWQEKCADDDERTQLVGICTELLHLCDHLGVIRPKQAGGAE
jgi:hypothetical protein